MRQVLRWLILFFPGFWLFVESLSAPSDNRLWLWVGSGICLTVAALMAYFSGSAPSARLSAVIIPLVGYLWLLFIKPAGDLVLRSLTEAVFILLPVLGLMSFWLTRSGGLMYRRARQLMKVLALKTNWPVDLTQCRELPEVQAFRRAIQFDASPALELLEHAHPAVRMSALAALEMRQHWRIGQIERILRLLEGERIPEIRVAAIVAMANLRDRKSTEAIAFLLSDQDERVRTTACQSLFMKADRRNRDKRWQWMRNAVRHALSSTYLAEAGPLLQEGQLLSDEAVNDLVAWVADRGILGVRAAGTLAIHFSRLLREEPEDTSRELISLVENPHTPAILRIQLAKLLSTQYKGDLRLMEKLLFAGNPVPLRQMAAETLLIRTGRHPEALNTLREIARLGNREIALDTARIVQQCLNVDLGLAVGQAIPHPGSPRAADITRKLLQWAMQSEPSQNIVDLGGSRSQY
jgi:HEAT repeat protein